MRTHSDLVRSMVDYLTSADDSWDLMEKSKRTKRHILSYSFASVTAR